MLTFWPKFGFYRLPISSASRHQLAEAYRAAQSGVVVKTKLRDLIGRHCFDPARGIYLPISPDVFLKGKLPADLPGLSKAVETASKAKTPFPAAFFTNGLLVPEGYGHVQFDIDKAASPTNRATNIGPLFVTLEFDCETAQQFEQLMAWTRATKAVLPIASVDRELRGLADYRGYCAVFTGRRSLQFHFVFSTAHIEALPFDAKATDRCRYKGQGSALIANAHAIYWDHVWSVFERVLQPPLGPDQKLRSVVQWRRAPWAIRMLEKPSEILGLDAGVQVPQIVLSEHLRERAGKGAKTFLVPSTFTLANPIPVFEQGPQKTETYANEPNVLSLLQETCLAEWGEYPKPVFMGTQNGQWLIQFQNHPTDRNPSTLVLGEYRRLQLNGQHSFGNSQFFLPDHMTANELAEHVRLRCGITGQQSDGPNNPIPEQRQRTLFEKACSEPHEKAFPEPFVDIPHSELIDRYRRKLPATIHNSRDYCQSNIVVGVEGMGKTTAHLPFLADEAFDEALGNNDGTERFAAFAFRSRDQVKAKAAEFRDRGYAVKEIYTFRDHYEKACGEAGVSPIALDDIDESTPADILHRIGHEQPVVNKRLEEIRTCLWTHNVPFDSARTILVLTQKSAALWNSSLLTRAWHHPNFEPIGNKDDHVLLRDRFALGRIVFDDPEPDDFLHVLPVPFVEFFREQQQRYSNWRNKARRERLAIYRRLREQDRLPRKGVSDFGEFDALMREDFDRLGLYSVDYGKITFGHDTEEHGIYRSRHGDEYYLGPRRWLFDAASQNTFLTTEQFVADIIEKAIQQANETAGPHRINLTDIPGIYPIKVPICLDRRAGADRNECEKVTALAREIVMENPNAFVISDGVNGVESVKTFQSMKGLNGLEDRDVYVVLTSLAPEKYAQINVIGQWLGQGNVIQEFYQDQINQAVGRNQGFRKSTNKQTKTVAVASPRLWNSVLAKMQNEAPRVQLFLAEGRHHS